MGAFMRYKGQEEEGEEGDFGLGELDEADEGEYEPLGRGSAGGIPGYGSGRVRRRLSSGEEVDEVGEDEEGFREGNEDYEGAAETASRA